MCQADQEVRQRIDTLMQSKQYPARKSELRRCHEKKRSLARVHERALRAILERYGWPTRSIFGATAGVHAFILSVHARDLDLQKKCRELLRRAQRSDEADSFHYAYLWDRIALRQNRRQRFGTHFVRLGEDQWGLLPAQNPNSIDRRRYELGLMALREEICCQEAFEVCWTDESTDSVNPLATRGRDDGRGSSP